MFPIIIIMVLVCIHTQLDALSDAHQYVVSLCVMEAIWIQSDSHVDKPVGDGESAKGFNSD